MRAPLQPWKMRFREGSAPQGSCGPRLCLGDGVSFGATSCPGLKPPLPVSHRRTGGDSFSTTHSVIWRSSGERAECKTRSQNRRHSPRHSQPPDAPVPAVPPLRGAQAASGPAPPALAVSLLGGAPADASPGDGPHPACSPPPDPHPLQAGRDLRAGRDLDSRRYGIPPLCQGHANSGGGGVGGTKGHLAHGGEESKQHRQGSLLPPAGPLGVARGC